MIINIGMKYIKKMLVFFSDEGMSQNIDLRNLTLI